MKSIVAVEPTIIVEPEQEIARVVEHSDSRRKTLLRNSERDDSILHDGSLRSV